MVSIMVIPYIRSDAKEDMGIVPMPGIIDAQIRTQTTLWFS